MNLKCLRGERSAVSQAEVFKVSNRQHLSERKIKCEEALNSVQDLWRRVGVFPTTLHASFSNTFPATSWVRCVDCETLLCLRRAPPMCVTVCGELRRHNPRRQIQIKGLQAAAADYITVGRSRRSQTVRQTDRRVDKRRDRLTFRGRRWQVFSATIKGHEMRVYLLICVHTIAKKNTFLAPQSVPL